VSEEQDEDYQDWGVMIYKDQAVQTVGWEALDSDSPCLHSESYNVPSVH
jgi:hypothetical protein